MTKIYHFNKTIQPEFVGKTNKVRMRVVDQTCLDTLLLKHILSLIIGLSIFECLIILGVDKNIIELKLNVSENNFKNDLNRLKLHPDLNVKTLDDRRFDVDYYFKLLFERKSSTPHQQQKASSA